MQNIFVTYFRNEISVKELKIIIKFNVNFLSMALKDTFSLTMSVFERALDFTIYLCYNKNVGSPFFVKFFCQNQPAGGFP